MTERESKNQNADIDQLEAEMAQMRRETLRLNAETGLLLAKKRRREAENWHMSQAAIVVSAAAWTLLVVWLASGGG